MDKSHGLPAAPKSEPVLPPSLQELPSSPPSIASDVAPRRKPKKPPPVTPRSFKRFFTPRSMLSSGNSVVGVKSNRQALRILSSPALNRSGPAFTRASKPSGNKTIQNEPADVIRTPARKRKLSFSSMSSPLQSSPLRRVRIRVSGGDEGDLEALCRDHDIGCEAENEVDKHVDTPKLYPVPPIRRSRVLETAGSLCMRSVSGSQFDQMIVRSNSGAGQFLFRILRCDIFVSYFFRMARFDFNFLLAARRQPFLLELRPGPPDPSILYRFVQ